MNVTANVQDVKVFQNNKSDGCFMLLSNEGLFYYPGTQEVMTQGGSAENVRVCGYIDVDKVVKHENGEDLVFLKFKTSPRQEYMFEPRVQECCFLISRIKEIYENDQYGDHIDALYRMGFDYEVPADGVVRRNKERLFYAYLYNRIYDLEKK